MCWYVAYPISDRYLEEMREEHAKLNHRVLKYVPLLEQECLQLWGRSIGGYPMQRFPGDSNGCLFRQTASRILWFFNEQNS